MRHRGSISARCASASSARFSSQHVHARLAEDAERAALACALATSCAHLAPAAGRAPARRARPGTRPRPARCADRGRCRRRSPDRPAPARCCPDRRRAAPRCAPCTASSSAGLGGPRFEPLEAPRVVRRSGAVADGRPQKYFGSSNGWPISARADRLAVLARSGCRWPGSGKTACATPVTTQRVDDAGDERQQHEQRRARDEVVRIMASPPRSAERRGRRGSCR